MKNERHNFSGVEKALLENQQRYERMANTVPVMLYDSFIASDRTSRFFYVAPGPCREILELDPDALLKDMSLVWDIVHPDDLARFYQEDIVANKIGKEFLSEVRIITPSGQLKWLLVNSKPNPSKPGEPLVWSGYLQDITARKQAEEKLRESQSLLHSILENIPIRVFWKDIDLNYLGCNTAFARSAGRSQPEDVLGKSDFQMCWKDQAEVFRYDDKQVIDSEIPKIGTEKEVITPDGKTTWIRTSKVPMYNKRKKVIGMLGIDEDISDQKKEEEEKAKLEAQLHQSQKIESVGKLAGGVAHDYNNMLSIIIGYAELAQMKLDSAHAIQENLKQILSAANRSRDITRQLLAFARKQTIDPKILDLNASIESTLKLLRNLLGENIDLNWKPQNGLWPVKMDPSQLDQILANLCINARDAIIDVGKLIVETGKIHFDQAQCDALPGLVPGDYVTLTISDDGCGMEPEILDQIFEPFFTTKQVGEGTGLGLAMVYGVVKQNNGYIDVSSEPGEGTSIKIYLPRHVGQVMEVPDKALGSIPQGHGETVLLVEDEVGILKLAATQLKAWNYHVIVANSPSEALIVAKAYPGEIDLLVTDVVMPMMNGRELADRLQLMYPQLRCLYMSGYAENAIAHHGVLDKGIHFIPKPFSGQEFGVKVRKVLDSAI
ncbi:MAG: PAS domain S-box protein [Desulfuromonadales bacterium]|nr:PAS domain S-box protein [Desulfuromonadales bacterium]